MMLNRTTRGMINAKSLNEGKMRSSQLLLPGAAVRGIVIAWVAILLEHYPFHAEG
jgi:hypothetical protein